MEEDYGSTKLDIIHDEMEYDRKQAEIDQVKAFSGEDITFLIELLSQLLLFFPNQKKCFCNDMFIPPPEDERYKCTYCKINAAIKILKGD